MFVVASYRRWFYMQVHALGWLISSACTHIKLHIWFFPTSFPILKLMSFKSELKNQNK